ncbi:uncharacterized protein LOC144248887 isoform X1 [Lonchura striata]
MATPLPPLGPGMHTAAQGVTTKGPLSSLQALTCSKEFFAALPVSREHEQMVSTQPCLDPLGYFTVSHKNTTVWPWLCNMMEPKKSLLPDSKNLGCWHNMSMA